MAGGITSCDWRGSVPAREQGAKFAGQNLDKLSGEHIIPLQAGCLESIAWESLRGDPGSIPTRVTKFRRTVRHLSFENVDSPGKAVIDLGRIVQLENVGQPKVAAFQDSVQTNVIRIVIDDRRRLA